MNICQDNDMQNTVSGAVTQSPSRPAQADSNSFSENGVVTQPPSAAKLQDAPISDTMPPLGTQKPSGETRPPVWKDTATKPLHPGDVVLNRYEVLAELGCGAMGIVYQCRDRVSGIIVAMKKTPPELSRSTGEMAQILENYQLVAKLVHKNIAIYRNLERDPETGDYFLIMEYACGIPLNKWMEKKRAEHSADLEHILPVVRQIAEALDYAHAMKVLHRDIKPANVLVDDADQVKVLDFGIATELHSAVSRLTNQKLDSAGTAFYMAPEQWRGAMPEAATDQYALATMTYEMFAGHLPFAVGNREVLQTAILTQPAPVLESLPVFAQNALKRALSKNPEERFDSCHDFADALANIRLKKNKVPLKEKLLYYAVIVIMLTLIYCAGMWRNHVRSRQDAVQPVNGIHVEGASISENGTVMLPANTVFYEIIEDKPESGK